MAAQLFGKVEATGTTLEIDLVRRALGRSTIDVSYYLASKVRIEWGDTPLVPGTSTRSLAFAFSGQRRIVIRKDQSAKPGRAQYLVLHELGHFVDNDHLSNVKRDKLRALMEPRPSSWGDARTYYWSPAETFADTFAVAFGGWDNGGPLRGIYERSISDYPAFRKIVKHPGLLHLMPELKRIESSGHLHAQNPSSGASGLYGFMPKVWREEVAPILDYEGTPVASAALPPQEWLPEMTAANQERAARVLLNRRAKRFDEQWQLVAVSWRNGEFSEAVKTPIADWPTHRDAEGNLDMRGEIKYVNDACVPLGYAAIPLPIEEEDDIVKLLVGAVPNQVGTIPSGTPLFHPTTLEPVTNLIGTAEDAPIVGLTPDGKYHGVLAITSKMPGDNRKLLLVEASAVSNLRVSEDLTGKVAELTAQLDSVNADVLLLREAAANALTDVRGAEEDLDAALQATSA